MLSRLTVKNYKSLDIDEIEFSKFNLLTGTNSSGKSSIIQCILLLGQRHQQEVLNGTAISLGTFENVMSFQKNLSDIISISSVTNSGEISIELSRDQTAQIKKNTSDSLIIDKDLFYLSADRNGVMDTHLKNRGSKSVYGNLGEYTINVLELSKDTIMEESILTPSDLPTRRVIDVVGYWVNHIGGHSIELRNIENTDLLQVNYFSGLRNATTNYIRPKHVGVGLSHLITIITLCLTTPPGAIIIIENPEIHLHPRAQSELAKFLIAISECDKQIIVETHSDHIFNAVRVAIAENQSNIQTMIVNYISKIDDDISKVTQVKIGEYGSILNKEANLFDQFISDTGKMISKSWK